MKSAKLLSTRRMVSLFTVVFVALYSCRLLSAESLKASAPSLVTHERGVFQSVIRTIVSYKNVLWFGTYGNGLYGITPSHRLLHYTSKDSPLLEDRVNTLAVFKGELWIGTCKGICVFDGSQKWRSYVAGKDSVKANIYHCMRVSPDESEIWIGMTGEGISIFNGTSWRHLGKDNGILNQWVNDVAFSEGDVWVSTLSGTFVKKHGTSTYSVSIPPNYPVNRNTVSMAALKTTGEVWIASTEKGVYCFQEGYWYHPPDSLLPSPNVYWLCSDTSDRLWIGTDKGISSMKLDEGFQSYVGEKGPEDPYTKVIYCDSNSGFIWAGSYGGVLSVYKDGVFQTVFKDGQLVK